MVLDEDRSVGVGRAYGRSSGLKLHKNCNQELLEDMSKVVGKDVGGVCVLGGGWMEGAL